jgi:hypothetical protein
MRDRERWYGADHGGDASARTGEVEMRPRRIQRRCVWRGPRRVGGFEDALWRGSARDFLRSGADYEEMRLWIQRMRRRGSGEEMRPARTARDGVADY